MTTAFITGITGQDGSYLAQLLLSKGYEVHGLVRWDAAPVNPAIEALGVTLHYGDMTDALNLTALLKEIQPDEIYNLAALSHVRVSFDTPGSVFDINAKGTLNLLESVRVLGLTETKIYQASSSEMFGSTPAPQNEESAFNPCSPYGVAKLAAFHTAKMYRESYGMSVFNGILFNHESPIRGEDFVTRKIAKAAVEIEAGIIDTLMLGNLDALRDWGHARDYVRGMWMMLQTEEADDYVLATGESLSVRDFVQIAFAKTGVTIEWQGEGVNEIGIDTKTGKTLITIDPDLFRPSEVDHLLGDASKAQDKLGWVPEINFETLVSEMIESERQKIQSHIGQEPWQQTG